MDVILPSNILKTRVSASNTKAYIAMVKRSIDWLKEDISRDPEYSTYGSMVFNDGEDADVLGDILVDVGENLGIFVEPIMVVNAALDAKNILKYGYDKWVEISRNEIMFHVPKK